MLLARPATACTIGAHGCEHCCAPWDLIQAACRAVGSSESACMHTHPPFPHARPRLPCLSMCRRLRCCCLWPLLHQHARPGAAAAHRGRLEQVSCKEQASGTGAVANRAACCIWREHALLRLSRALSGWACQAAWLPLAENDRSAPGLALLQVGPQHLLLARTRGVSPGSRQSSAQSWHAFAAAAAGCC